MILMSGIATLAVVGGFSVTCVMVLNQCPSLPIRKVGEKAKCVKESY